MANLSPNLNIMLRAAEKAARSLSRDFGEVENLQVSRKGPGDFVSAADKRAEQIIYDELSNARPGYSFLMEESGEHKGTDGEYRFIVDPLDGTTNFLHGIPHWCISIGLEKQGEMVAGLIFDPIKNEVFHAEKGSGAFTGKRRLRVSARSDLSFAVICGGDCVRRTPEVKAGLLKGIEKVINTTAGFRRSGSAALDLAYVAAGRYEGFWENNLAPWDTAAGTILVREAGGAVASLKGDTNPVYAQTLLATNMALHNSLKDMLKV
jgi:myo-inositol-1(or 4)-monophosphatase